MNTLEQKWALVTGATRGIGKVIAEELGRRGCNVIVHGRTASACAATVDRITAMGRESFAIAAALEDAAQVQQLIDTAMQHTGGVDILYNNAGLQNAWREISDLTYEDWQHTFAVNVFAPAMLCAAFVPVMKSRGFGRIANVSSGIQDCPQLSPYGAAKWAIDKYTAELAAELQGTNVMVNAIDPGWIKTDLGGPNADHEIDTVLPGMMVPILVQPGDPTGHKFRAQDFKHLK
ncbi:MAG: SDR family oxidoreductase [Proteobacteria bacterium]|nr:SDR family oxidoreductase [Pseudomonadota bacterium]